MTSPGVPFRILGIYPGLTATGYGVIEVEGSRHSVIESGTVRSGKGDLGVRLRRINDAILHGGRFGAAASDHVGRSAMGRRARELAVHSYDRHVATTSFLNMLRGLENTFNTNPVTVPASA